MARVDRRRGPIGIRDFSLVDRGYETECWIRHGLRNNRGYTRIHCGGKSVYAHRAMYEQEIGPIPAGLVLDHLCEQRDCINPRHLQPVTDAENKRRGRGTKLTHELVAAIRSDSRPQRAVAADYGISASHVCRIRSGKKWAVA